LRTSVTRNCASRKGNHPRWRQSYMMNSRVWRWT
jgi:hypothetical protein